MTCQQAKKCTNVIFQKIIKAKSIDDLEKIESKFDKKYRMDSTTYPKIDFSLTKDDIEKLKLDGFLDEDGNITNDTKKIEDPMTKLLYSLAWKNGDLKKLKHIVEGVEEYEKTIDNQEKAFVFYQFGKFLTKTNQPIIDQHVIRAFLLYKCNQNDCIKIEEIRKLSIIKKNNKDTITEYIKWLQSNELDALKNQEDYTYYIDKILFALGKTIKLQKTSNK